MWSARIVIGCRAPGGCRVDGSVTSMPFGDQHRGVAFGAQDREPFVVAPLGFGPRGVDPLAGVGALVLGDAAQRLARQGQRCAVAEVLGLEARQCVEIAGAREGLPGGADRFGQGFRRQVDGLITHAATLSLLMVGCKLPSGKC